MVFLTSTTPTSPLQTIFDDQAIIQSHRPPQKYVWTSNRSSESLQTFVFQNWKWQNTNTIIQYKTLIVLLFSNEHLCLFSFEIMRRAILKFGMLLLILGLAISNSLHKSFFLVHAFSDFKCFFHVLICIHTLFFKLLLIWCQRIYL